MSLTLLRALVKWSAKAVPRGIHMFYHKLLLCYGQVYLVDSCLRLDGQMEFVREIDGR
ncbi:MAG: hypothetical protein NPIRA02_33500 [Nitrospirales bacterium]|nr:MAG: hypothetical protein NPIRA02_33500 [Nitrospirales bacterium]